MLNRHSNLNYVPVICEDGSYYCIFLLDSILLHSSMSSSKELNLVFYDNCNYTEKLGRIYKEVYMFKPTSSSIRMAKRLKFRRLANAIGNFNLDIKAAGSSFIAPVVMLIGVLAVCCVSSLCLNAQWSSTSNDMSLYLPYNDALGLPNADLVYSLLVIV